MLFQAEQTIWTSPPSLPLSSLAPSLFLFVSRLISLGRGVRNTLVFVCFLLSQSPKSLYTETSSSSRALPLEWQPDGGLEGRHHGQEQNPGP